MQNNLKSAKWGWDIRIATYIMNTTNSFNMKGIFRAQRSQINIAYWCGFLPIHFESNSYGKIPCRPTKLRRFIWLTNVGISAVTAVYLGINLCLDILHQKIVSPDEFDFIRILNTFLLCLMGFFHVHTIWKVNDLYVAMSKFSLYCDSFRGLRVGTPEYKKQSKFYQHIMQGIWFSLLAHGVLIFVIFFMNCELHVLSPLLPVCESVADEAGELKWTMESAFYILMYAILQFLFAFSVPCGVAIYLAVPFPFLLVGLDLIKELADAETPGPLHEYANWSFQYRCYQLLLTEFNNAFKDLVMPVHILCLSLLIVLGNYVLIRIQVEIEIYVLLAVMNFTCLALLGLVMHQGSQIQSFSNRALMARKRLPRTRFQSKHLKSCRLYKVKLGSFGCMAKIFPVFGFEAILYYSMTALITFK